MPNFTTVNWPPLTEITSARMQAMMDNDQYLKDRIDTMPNGVLAVGSRATDVSGITTEQWFGFNLPVTLTSQRTLRITFTWWAITGGANNDIYTVRIKQGTSTPPSIGIQSQNVICPIAGSGTSGGTMVYAGLVGPGTLYFDASVTRASGTGTGAVTSTSFHPAQLIIEDMGPPISFVNL